MNYNKFKRMMKIIRDEVAYFRALLGEKEVVLRITDTVIYDYFWDYVNDKPTCNYEQMEIAIQNTVRNLLRV